MSAINWAFMMSIWRSELVDPPSSRALEEGVAEKAFDEAFLAVLSKPEGGHVSKNLGKTCRHEAFF